MVRQHPTQYLAPTQDCSIVDIPMRDGHMSNIRVYQPASSTPVGLFVLLHGGGFCLGDNANVGLDPQALATLHDITVVSISYRLAPENKFPTAPNDVWDTMVWLTTTANARSVGIQLSNRFFIGGISAGANLAAVTAQQWVTKAKKPSISGVWLSMPMLLDAAIVPERFKEVWISREQNAEAMILDKPALDFIKSVYAPDVLSADYSPFNAETAHERFPPVYFQICGQDPLRDDGLVYEKVLRENGVQTKVDIYPGVPHGFADVFKNFAMCEQWKSDILKGITWLVGQSVVE
ncbi:hypothetical protein BFJ69_g7845 [Fusarium oxysporum]|uniref:Alpha/beta hydrolase fold-3 domain-containing protein n=1 Tax=Fusarium oxysporum TaxID=5507 RepID=A0A420N4R4_FUSOX|nr:hypothetical protein BFJ69_g7845 [Fusarium oxysporum]